MNNPKSMKGAVAGFGLRLGWLFRCVRFSSAFRLGLRLGLSCSKAEEGFRVEESCSLRVPLKGMAPRLEGLEQRVRV